MAVPAPVPDKAKIRLKQEFGNGTKNSLQVLNELGYREKEHFRCEETERPTGVGSIKTFICEFTVNGCPAFPPGEGPSKKNAKENAGKPVASYLLGTGPTTSVKPTGTVPAVSSPAGRLVTDGGKTAKLQEEYRKGAKTAAAILHEYAVLKDLDKPQCKECEGPNPSMPFGCVWRVGNKDYPVGIGRTKQDARQNAAKYALERLFLKTDANPSPKSERKHEDPPPQKPKQQHLPTPPLLPPGPAPPSDNGYNDCYRVSSKTKGYVLLINNVDFPNHEDPHRAGSDKDAKDLEIVFTSLGFKVIPKRNLTGGNMFATIRTFARDEDHEAVDCSVLVILSHGDNGNILGTDNNVVKEDEIISQFHSSRAKALAGKPKLFLFQACRGGKEDYVVTDGAAGDLQTDATRRSLHRENLFTDHYTKDGKCIPEMADLLICHSTNAGMVSYRQEGNGSIFVQIVCQALTEYALNMEMTQILTKVNFGVSEFEATKEKGKDTVKVKQISEYRSTLRKPWKLWSG